MSPASLLHACRLSNQLKAAADLDRRRLLQAVLGVAGMAMLPASVRGQYRSRFTAYPFTLGVASGYPRPDGVSLWTRLAPEPLQPDGGMLRDEWVTVRWQVATDEAFGQVVAEGEQRAVGELGHSVHVDVAGLLPARRYHYRFIAGDEVSPTGSTLTAPAGGQKTDRLRFAIGSCQHYEQGWFSAYRHMHDDAPDLVLFLGDYIYESAWGDVRVRRHAGGEPYELGEYRSRHAQYKLDVDLQRAHGAMPWMVVWDDHEVDNDPAGEQSEHLDPRFLLRRAAAYQAFFEHMPLPRSMRPDVHGRMRLHTELGYGDLARIFMLDTRQYRSPQACPGDFKGGGSTRVDPEECAELGDAARSMLGREQESWLSARLQAPSPRWNVIAQTTLFAHRDDQPGAGVKAWTDGWSGYPAARQRLLADLAQHGGSNPLIVGGDIHATFVADVQDDPWTARPRSLASEVCGTSISSQGAPQALTDGVRADNPHVKFARSDRRGYCLLDVRRNATEVSVRALDDVTRRDTRIETLARFNTRIEQPGWES